MASTYSRLCDLLYVADFLSVSEAALLLRVSEHEADDLLNRYWREHPDAAFREFIRRRERKRERESQ